MATTSGDGRCNHWCVYCWRELEKPVEYARGEALRSQSHLHNPGCPINRIEGLQPETEEFNNGYARGWSDEIIRSYLYQYYSSSFLLGYRVGKAEIDRLVDDAAQSRYF